MGGTRHHACRAYRSFWAVFASDVRSVSLPLKDLRTAVPDTTDVWLEIESRATGKDKAAVARDALNEWAKGKAHAFKVAHRLLQANGAQTDWLGEDSVEAAIPGAVAGNARKDSRR